MNQSPVRGESSVGSNEGTQDDIVERTIKVPRRELEPDRHHVRNRVVSGMFQRAEEITKIAGDSGIRITLASRNAAEPFSFSPGALTPVHAVAWLCTHADGVIEISVSAPTHEMVTQTVRRLQAILYYPDEA